MKKINLDNIKAYFTGNWRYRLYYSKLRFLIPLHIREQYEMRLQLMDKECYNNGECKICSCATTNLQFANRECDKPCYPPMMSKSDWSLFMISLRYTKTNIKDRSKVLSLYKYIKGESNDFETDIYN